MFDITLLAVCGGLYVVPLYAYMQAKSDPAYRARTIACNNIINALFMAGSAIIAMLLFAINFSIIQIFLLIAIVNVFVALYICKLLPEALLQSFAKWLLQSLYRVKLTGMEHYYQAGENMIIIVNHTSMIDVVLISAFLPHY